MSIKAIRKMLAMTRVLLAILMPIKWKGMAIKKESPDFSYLGAVGNTSL